MSWESFSNFFNTSFGMVAVSVVACFCIFIMVGSLYKNKHLSIKTLTYSSLAICLSLILSNVKLFHLPQGGSVTAFSMFFIVLIGYWFGPLVGVLGGFTCGLLQLAIAPYVVHPIQLLLDYPFAFGALGLSGFYRSGKNGLLKGYLFGVSGRFLCSFLSGFIFFASYAPENLNPVLYSFIYNLSYIVPEAVLTIILISVPAFKLAIKQAFSNLYESD